MYTVIGSAKNRTLRVIWALEELGLEYEQVAGNPGSPEVREHIATGKLPGLLVDGKVYTDSVAILNFLADRHGALTFPAGSVERMELDGHVNFILEEFDSLLWIAGKNTFINPKEYRSTDIKPVLKWEFERSLSRLEDRFKGPFLMGDTFTIADILAVHCLNWGFVAKFPPATDKLKAYGKAMRQRPAYKRAMERP